MECTVARVLKGDRFLCEDGPEVGLADSVRALPENERYGRIAAQSLRALLQAGSTVRLLLRTSKGTTAPFAFVFMEDGTFVNEFLAARGYVYLDVGTASTEYDSRIEAAVARARAEGRGVWSPGR